MLQLRSLRKQYKISQVELASRLGVTQATLSGWETEKYEIDNKSLRLLSEIFNVSIDYILGNDASSSPTPSKKGIKIPVLGNVQAGIPVEAVQEILDWEEITEDMAAQGDHFGLAVKGHSMEPRFAPDDVVIVRKQSTAETGDVVIALVNGDDATIKKLKKMENGIMLVPTNPDFEAMFYTNEEIEKKPVRIIGKVVELRAKF